VQISSRFNLSVKLSNGTLRWKYMFGQYMVVNLIM